MCLLPEVSAAIKLWKLADKFESSEAILSDAQAANLRRFDQKLPAGANPTTITKASDGSVTFTAEVPGRVPGSSAIYQKTVDAAGNTVGYTKTTIGPDGSVIHVKRKFP
jgi:hypothetical protein